MITTTDILHEIKHIETIWKGINGVKSVRADDLRNRVVERSMRLIDEMVIYLPVEDK